MTLPDLTDYPVGRGLWMNSSQTKRPVGISDRPKMQYWKQLVPLNYQFRSADFLRTCLRVRRSFGCDEIEKIWSAYI